MLRRPLLDMGESWCCLHNASGIAVTTAALLISTLLVYVVVVHLRRKSLPPGPWPLPIFGNLGVLLGLPHRNLHKLADKYGGLMYLQLGQVPCLVVSTAAAAKEIFKAHDAAFSDRPKRLDHKIISGTTYKSLTSAPYGPYWRQVRRVCNTELFSKPVHASHENVRKEEIHNMIKVIRDECQAGAGAAIDLNSWTTGLMANNMTRMLINKRYFGTGVTDEQERKDFEELNEHVLGAYGSVYVSDYIPSLAWVDKVQGHITKLQEIRSFLRRVVGKIFEVEKHRQRALERERGKKDDEAQHVPDFVDVLLKTPLDDGEQFTDGEIISILSSMIYAGTDSSATTVEWAMSELVAHPELLQKAQQELDAVVGGARLVQESDLPRLPFLSAVVKETFRLHPPVPLSLPRSSNQPCVVANRLFPVHTRLILNIFAIHRDPSVYHNPEAFQPSRFLEHPEVDPMSWQSNFQLIPFGVGRRMCPASHLGNTLVTLVLAHLLHSFHWSVPADAHLDMAEVYRLVAFRKQALALLAQPRSPASLY